MRVREQPLPVLKLLGQRVGLGAFQAGDAGDDVRRDDQADRADDRGCAVARDGRQQHADADHCEQRDQVDGVGGEHEQQRFRSRHDGAREGPDRVKAPRGDAGDGGDGGRQEDCDRGVGHRGDDLCGEHLAAVDRACEDRLERAVAVLVGDHVAGDQRGDQGQHEGGQEQQREHGRGQPRLSDLSGEDVVGAVTAALVDVLEDHEEQRQDHDQAQTQIRALLGNQLAQLQR